MDLRLEIQPALLSKQDPWGYCKSDTKVTTMVNLFDHEKEKEIFFEGFGV